jgi:pimeloyl-ACP methyl ester carboxylesterase
VIPPSFHRAVDRLAMGFEDRVRRAPQAYRPGPVGSLDVLGRLGPLPPPPAGSGAWQAPSPPPFEGDRIRVHVEAATGRRRGTAILVPPWKLRARGLLRGWTRMIAGTGHEAWLLVPPHHLERSPPGARSGEAFVTPDLAALRAALLQTVLEVRLLAAMAGARAPDEGVALVGLSLGALAAAWAATAPERLDAVALVAPPADLAAVFATTPIGRRYAALAARSGAPFPPGPELAERLRWLSPLDRRPTARNVLVAGGEEDAIALDGPSTLARAWGLPLSRHPRGHLTLILGCAALRREVRALLDAPAGPALTGPA